ncbi:cytochrome P450 [Desarmillaria tabescens]|uniref:Cytochrome P450 n=1 Tax=Armillaria tabescens TaxID=1929756 RepID=A0AA39MYY1_ARMTA|nr:cytochrome P450 [Desarmillaria tabescens]KAK0451234.1 cytochrome P450 [Desarmillaria tabescens]
MEILTIFMVAVVSLFFLFKYRKHRPIQQLQGPPRPSLLLGHELDLRAQPTVGGLETAWQKAYGNTFRIGGCFAQDILMTSDPKAIQHILRNSGYQYPKTKDVAHLWDMVVGKGLVAVTGPVHQRQRRILSPAFSASQLKEYMANASDNKLLDEDEVLSQLATFTLGGEDTTAATVAWTLYELSRQPDYQARVREELRKGPGDYDSTPLLNAAINESLRLHPIVYTFSRYAAQDDAIPLSNPIHTRTGETWNEIPVKKGQMVMISAYTYNRLSSVWGDSPDDWIPERFFAPEAKDRISVGLHANLLKFSDGVHGCIGWK